MILRERNMFVLWQQQQSTTIIISVDGYSGENNELFLFSQVAAFTPCQFKKKNHKRKKKVLKTKPNQWSGLV